MESILSLSHHSRSPLPLPSSPSLSPLPLFLRPSLSSSSAAATTAAASSPPPISASHIPFPPLQTPTPFPQIPRTTTITTTTILDLARKPLALLLFSVAIGFLPSALAQSGLSPPPLHDHEFSIYTRKLLSAVSVLLERIEEVRASKGDLDIVREALKEVKERRKEVQGEVLGNLNAELRELRKDREELVKKSSEVMEAAFAARKERDRLLKSEGGGGDEVRESVERLERRLGEFEKEYNGLWEKIGEIEDRISRRETLTFSIAIRELSFIERESELLVERFSNQLRRKDRESVLKSIPSRLSRDDVQKDLEAAQNKYWEQMLLPTVLEAEDFEIYSATSTRNFALQIKEALKESKKLQSNLENQIRRKMKKFGDEKRFVVRTPEEEVLKGFPEVELKWRFGENDVVVPKAVTLHLFHGWKKWREEAKAKLKRELLENADLGREYMVQRQERILLDRERVMTKTWFNDERNRWEMDPVAVPYAVSRKLVESARIRHDWGVMYLALKGDDREYYVDIKEFDLLFEEFGGFDGMYLKMLASGIPTAVQLMWIPLSELDIRQQFLLVTRILSQCLIGLWNSGVVSYVRAWVFSKIKNITDDFMVVVGFPLVELIIPKQVRMSLGMAWPEEAYQFVGTTWYLKWQSEAEMNYRSRKTNSIRWYLWFLIRSAIYGYVLFNVFCYLKRKIPKLLGYGPLRRDPNLRKFRRVKFYFQYKLLRRIRRKKEGIDPIRTAFDQMKRVKNPPIRLEDFASVDSMREEINDIVTCLRNPTAFQEKGARAPRGVLIVGERGTGKTSLALAIAAEAKVPVVEVKAHQLEAGLWVGQSASNVRELFQTARDLAPVIIFVEDFDLFAGVRGQFIHTTKQDHEAFINQLLVELDGFENQDGVLLMATTRNLKQIDEALKRPGRMDRVLHLQRPTQMEREKILQFAAKETMDKELIDFVDWKKVAEKTALLRPIELKLVPLALEGSAFRSKFLDTDELMSYCSWFATFSSTIPKWLRRTPIAKKISKHIVNHLGLTLTREDMQQVVDLMEPYGQISNGIELLSPPLDWSMETKFPHAVWAAGRGLITLLLPNFDIVDNIWLEPTAWRITVIPGKEACLLLWFIYCISIATTFRKENFLSSSELKQAQEIATRMVIQYGWGPDDSPAIYITSKACVGSLSMGNNHEFEMAAKMYDLGYDKAREMLLKNRKVLEKIVEQLLEFENLTGEDLINILNENGGIREQEPFFLSKSYYSGTTSSLLKSHLLTDSVI
uniref:AAA+ ATPase domain-containing protein n=1 Tax=Ananas comosus var. bracteatus TaxID=296719 RepID=A0A6V7QXZ2_ANACO